MDKINQNENTNNLFKEIPLSPTIADNLDVVPDMLTPDELELVDLFIRGYRGPQPTRSVRNNYMVQKVHDHRVDIIRFERYKEKYDPTEKEDIEKTLPDFKKFIEEYDKNKFDMPHTKFYSWLEDKIKELRLFEIPSYEKINNCLLSLMDLGIFAQRKDSRKNAKYLWIFNPKFNTLWSKRRREIIADLRSETNPLIRQSMYEMQIMVFYNINLEDYVDDPEKYMKYL